MSGKQMVAVSRMNGQARWFVRTCDVRKAWIQNQRCFVDVDGEKEDLVVNENDFAMLTREDGEPSRFISLLGHIIDEGDEVLTYVAIDTISSITFVNNDKGEDEANIYISN